MPPFNAQQAEETAAGALRRVLIAAEWLSDARSAALEPNGRASYERRVKHARDRMLEAIALIDGRPAMLGMERPPRAEGRQP